MAPPVPCQNPSHAYAGAGVYTVSLTVTGAGGSNTKTNTNYITVTAPTAAPVAGFSATPTSGTSPLTVNFTNASTGSITSYAWNFGDGTSSTAASPSHAYAAAGVYTVSLTVTGAGGSNTKTNTNYITVTAPTAAPVAGFSATPTSGTSPLTVNFTNASTGSITSYAWNFGDGTSSTAASPSHVYAAAGVYTVSLTVTGAGGSNTKTNTNYITVTAPTAAPVAGFSATPTSGTSPLTVNFTNASTGSITSYAWNFGDGTSSSAASPSHAYAAAGVYTVSLTVTGAGGSNTKTNTNYITVTAPTAAPVAGFSATPTSGTSPLTVNFSNASTGSITSYAWNFGDGTSSSAASPSHAYAAAGVYTVSLTVTGAGGSNTKTNTNYITVTAPTAAPVAGFSATPTSGTSPLTVNFTNASTGSITSYAWNFGDGTSSSAASPSHAYAAAGVYTVSLTVTGAGGSNTKTNANYITVSAPPPPSGAPLLTGSMTNSLTSVDLTSVGSSDWAQWPGNYRKATGGGKISDRVLIGGIAKTYADARTMTWRDGSPVATGSTNNGESMSGNGSGFQISAPADTTTRTLVVYLGAASATGTLNAHLSDGSAVDLNASFGTKNKRWDGLYTISYRAASAGQTLTVTLKQTSQAGRKAGWGGTTSGSINLQGAALAGGAP